MALYCTPADVRNVLAPSTAQNQPSTAAAMSDADLTQAISEAMAQVDSALALRYAVPFDNPGGSGPATYTWPDGTTGHVAPFLVFQVTRDIAAYKATTTYRQGQELPPTHPVWLRYRDAVGTSQVPGVLDKLANGRLTLEVTETGQLEQGDEMVVVNAFDGDMWQLDDLGISAAPGGKVDLLPGGWPRSQGWW